MWKKIITNFHRHNLHRIDYIVFDESTVKNMWYTYSIRQCTKNEVFP